MNPETAIVKAEDAPLTVTRSEVKRFVSKNAAGSQAAATAIFSKFEDKSLPPIIKPGDLSPGDVIIGQIVGFGQYQDDKMDSALLTLELLDINPEWQQGQPEENQFVRLNQKAALPCTAVLARALGTTADKKTSSDKQIADIKRSGHENAIIAVRYTGTGKERGDTRNAPHLFDVKVRKASGAVHVHTERIIGKSSPGGKAK